MKTSLELGLILALHLVLTALPGVAATLFAARRGVRQVPILLAVGLCASGLIGLLGFWAFYADRLVGDSFAYFTLLGSALTIAWCLWEGVDRSLLRRLAVPLGLWVLGTAFIVFFGFLHGGSEAALGTSANRFTASSLPSDNDIPLFFAEWFFGHGHAGTPPVFPGEWLASDRPPLQIGYVLPQMSVAWGKAELHYQLLGVALQQLWIVGLWALLVAARIGRTTRALAMLTVLVSDLAIVNGFFVWPKMLPTAMLLAVAALVLTPLWEQARRSLWTAALIAALCGLAMMGHGSSVFGIVGLAAVAAFRGLPDWRWLGVAALVGIAVMAPWSAYQSYGDPPGNRLTKWFLAGVVDVDQRGVGESIADSYREAGLSGTADNKLKNLERELGAGELVTNTETGVEFADEGRWADVLRQVRTILFLYLLPSLALLLLGPVAMALRWRRRGERPREWDLAVKCWAAFGLGALAWALILFGGDNAPTVIHQGSYLIPALGICAAAVGLRAVLPRFAIWWLAFNAAVMLFLYTPSLQPAAGSVYSVTAATLAVVSLVGFGLLALGWPLPGRRRPAEPEPAEPALQTAG
ncbi:MAG TPA: hypothetical protein VGO36_05275 [Solirubrobacterales bacterium]|nr:hypothetical protein [Solirubrobacterales bacterium]